MRNILLIVALLAAATVGAESRTNQTQPTTVRVPTRPPPPPRVVHVLQANPDNLEITKYNTAKVVFKNVVQGLTRNCRALATDPTKLDRAWAEEELDWQLNVIADDALMVLDYEPITGRQINPERGIYLEWIQLIKDCLARKFPKGHKVRLMPYAWWEYQVVRACDAMHPDTKAWYPDHDPAWIAELRGKYPHPADQASISGMDNPNLVPWVNDWHVQQQITLKGLYLGVAWDRPVIPSMASLPGYKGGYYGAPPKWMEQVERSMNISANTVHRGVRPQEVLIFGSNPLTDELMKLVVRVMSN